MSKILSLGKAQINLSEDNFVVTHQRKKISLYSLLQNLAFRSLNRIFDFVEDTQVRK